MGNTACALGVGWHTRPYGLHSLTVDTQTHTFSHTDGYLWRAVVSAFGALRRKRKYKGGIDIL